MRAPTAVFLLSIAALAVLPAAGAAAVLKCQARAAYDQPGTHISFTGLAGDGEVPFTFEWDFGDGTNSLDQNPSHDYATAGLYLAVLRVTDGSAPTQACLDTVVVCAGLACDPTCLVSASSRWGEAPLDVQFTATPIFAPEPDSWSWRFGDGETGVGTTTNHAYATDGTYWAIATGHTAQGQFDCYPVRVSALDHNVVGIPPIDPLADAELGLVAGPNPFRTMTAIGYNLPRAGRMRLTIVDVSGRTVAELLDADRPAGRGTSVWQGVGTGGRSLPPGLYFARLEHEGKVRSIRLARTR